MKQTENKIIENKIIENINLDSFGQIELEQPLIEIEQSLIDLNEENESSFLKDKIVVIASSTGGPRTLEALLSQIPKNIPAPILIVQHMHPGFTKDLAHRLNKHSEIVVKEAEQNELLRNGVAFIAPGDFHMEIELLPNGEKMIKLNQNPSELGVRPNANRLFISAANIFKGNTIGVVLTGMGKDGTEGAKKIQHFNGLVIAESSQSCVLYGMPKSVFEARLADTVLDLDKIPVAILQAVDVRTTIKH